MRHKIPITALILSIGLLPAQKINFHVEVNNPARFDSGEESLRETPGTDVREEHRPLIEIPRQATSNNRPDGALQGTVGTLVNTTAGLGFDGVPTNGYAPPDTNMAIGPNHIVQWVNVRFAVYDKSGNRLSGPTNGNAFWSGFGGPCETQNSGDPIIQYDAVADRWIASQFTTSGPPYYQCFAVSQTPDPLGTYNRYAYAFSDGFNDYPKIGVWKNSYLASYNMFSSTSGGWLGPRICAYDRAAMLAGTSAVQECFNPGSAYGSLLPSDIDGGTAFAPPSNTAYFLDYGNNSLLLWRFTPDFVTPSNATLTGPVSIAAASFSPAGGGVPQPGTTNTLDTLSDRLMYRLAYRNFGTYEAMVVNHSVTAGTSIGVRWYEIRNPLTSPSIYQQGTYAPDATYRWMGSAAMDKKGNIAIGYSASSSTLYPSIRYTGRETTDPLGTLQAEQNVITSGGSQTGSLHRWGDYAAMRIDPTDDCTFWFTTEYLPASGTFNWNTRINSFKFNSCTASTSPDFSIAATPSSVAVKLGATAAYTVNTTALNSYSGTVSLSVTGLPANTTASFSPVSIAGTGSSTLSVVTTTATPAGSYTLTITGTDGTLTHTSAVTLVVQDFAVSATPSSTAVNTGSAASYTVNTSALNGYTGTIALTVSGLPTGASATFTPASVSAGASSTLSVTTNSATTPAGNYTLTITGNDGTVSRSANVTLVVRDFTVSASPSSQSVSLGGSTTFTTTIGQLNGFNSSVALSVSGLPSGATASFSPASITGAGNSTLTISTTGTTVTGTVTLTITGTSGGLVRSTTVSLTVNASPNFTISASPTSRTVKVGQSTTYSVTITPLNGFSGTVTLTVSGLPAKTSYSVSGTTITIQTQNGARKGTYPLTITGTSGSLVNSTGVSLTLN